jgi:preprotein translocase subunit SecG
VKTTLRIAELILAGSLVSLILMQSRGTSLGSVFGQEGSVFHTRRGAERILFNVSIGVALGFLIISVALARVNI